MGTWGAKVLESDLGLDVRESFLDLLREGLEPAKASARFLRDWREALGDPDDRAVVALALAETQANHGCLSPKVKSLALAILDEQAWSKAAEVDAKDREKEERRLRRVLTAKAKKFKRPPRVKKRDTELAPGEIVAYRHRDEWAILLVVGTEAGSRGAYPVLKLLGTPRKSVPTPEACATMPMSEATFFLFELKARVRRGRHHVIEGVRRDPPPRVHPKAWIGAFCCATDALTLDSAIKRPNVSRAI